MAGSTRPHGKTQIVSYLSKLEESQKEALGSAFAALLDTPASKQKQLLPTVLHLLARKSPPSDEHATKCEMDKEQLTNFVSAARLLASFVRADEQDDSITEGLQESLGLSADTLSAVRTLLTFLREDRGTLDTLKRRESLSNETLPSFQDVSVSTDIRFKVEDGVITNTVPVILMTIMTDAPLHFLSFQMTTEDLAEVREALDRANSAITVADKWISTRGTTE